MMYGYYRVVGDLGSIFIIMYRERLNEVIAVLDQHDIKMINKVWNHPIEPDNLAKELAVTKEYLFPKPQEETKKRIEQ